MVFGDFRVSPDTLPSYKLIYLGKGVCVFKIVALGLLAVCKHVTKSICIYILKMKFNPLWVWEKECELISQILCKTKFSNHILFTEIGSIRFSQWAFHINFHMDWMKPCYNLYSSHLLYVRCDADTHTLKYIFMKRMTTEGRRNYKD